MTGPPRNNANALLDRVYGTKICWVLISICISLFSWGIRTGIHQTLSFLLDNSLSRPQYEFQFT